MNRIFKKTILAAQLLLIASVSFSIARAAGEVDTTFNGGAFEQLGAAAAVIRQPDGKILIGGSFSVANGFYKLNLARLNADGTTDSTFNAPPLSGTVRAIAIQSDGKILVGGQFSGSNVLNVVRLNADGSRDTTFTPPNNVSGNQVNDILLQADGKILVGGQFQLLQGSDRKNFLRLNADGTIDETFTPANTNVPVQDLEAQPDGKILGVTTGDSGGVFLKRFNQDGTDDAAFTGAFLTPGGQSLFTLKAQANGKILIGGGFSFVNNTSKINLARLNADGTLDETFNTTSDGAVFDIEIGVDGKILVAGSFQQFNGSPRRSIVRLEDNGSLDGSFNFTETSRLPGANDVLPLPDGKIVVLGYKSVLGNNAPSVLRLNSNGTVDNLFRVLLGRAGSVTKIVQQPDGKILVIGEFSAVGNLERTRLARFNADGSADATFNPVINQIFNTPFINALAVQPDGKILVGGNFDGILLRLNPDGSRDTTFNAAVPTNNIPFDVAVQPDEKIIAVGSVSGSSLGFGYRFNQDGSIDAAFQAVQPNLPIRRIMIQPDGKIYIAGEFTFVNSTPRGRIARLNPDGSLDTTFNLFGGANNTVNDFAVQADGKVVIGGNFNGVNGATRFFAARLNANGTLDAEFTPSVNERVNAVRIQPNGKIIIGGEFTFVSDIQKNRIARLNSDGALDTSFNVGAGADGFVQSLALQSDGKILVGGNFSTINNVGATSIARLLSDAAARTSFDFDGDGKSDLSVFRPSNGAWYLQQSANGFAGQLFGQNGDVIAPGDFDGDGRTDLSVYRGGTWYIQRSQLGFTGIAFGSPDDLPVPADYDGDGKSDIAVFRPSNSTWYRLNSSNGQFIAVQFGQTGDKPVMGDYDGDGKADIAVFRPSNGVWYLLRSQLGFTGIAFGATGDLTVPADYDSDGKTDLAVYRSGTWYIQRSTLGFLGVGFGQAGDKPVPADYDGDGRADIAVFRPSNGVWYLSRTTQGFAGIGFGIAEDNPIPNAFVR